MTRQPSAADALAVGNEVDRLAARAAILHKLAARMSARQGQRSGYAGKAAARSQARTEHESKSLCYLRYLAMQEILCVS
jgi:hypothetical protein